MKGHSVPCAVCGVMMLGDGFQLECTDCHGVYHLGAECSGITRSVFKNMTVSVRALWKCQSCKTLMNTSATTGEASELGNLLAELKKINERVACLPDIKEKVGLIVPIQEKVNMIESTIGFLSAKYDELVVSDQKHSERLKEQKAKTEALEKNIVQQDAHIRLLTNRIEELEDYSRRQNMEINGLPKQKMRICFMKCPSWQIK